MIRKITKIGDSHGIIFDSTLFQLSHLNPGDEVNVEVRPDGMITIMPIDPLQISPATGAAAAKRIMGENSELFRRLS